MLQRPILSLTLWIGVISIRTILKQQKIENKICNNCPGLLYSLTSVQVNCIRNISGDALSLHNELNHCNIIYPITSKVVLCSIRLAIPDFIAQDNLFKIRPTPRDILNIQYKSLLQTIGWHVGNWLRITISFNVSITQVVHIEAKS